MGKLLRHFLYCFFTYRRGNTLNIDLMVANHTEMQVKILIKNALFNKNDPLCLGT